uniref:protein cornichon homolog 1 isoform X1 n=1 Tax=Fragaria vesca subsp. vesca TaxID=101020 RepID=UPI0005C9205C|nr:PREDICTED: protein cornichon homolog 1 isoform X1 [Fragaria vesca subsp. vesca]
MAWDLIYWLICFCLDIALFASSLYQYVMLTDLEADYINPFELSSRINQLVVPEFIVHGVFCALFLLAQRWFMFLFTVPLTYYIVMLFVKQKHLIDVTEVFRVLNTEKKCRLVKLGVYFCLLAIIIIRLLISTIFVPWSGSEELDIRASFLEF